MDKTRPVETHELDRDILETLGLEVLIALEKICMPSQGRGLGTPCVTVLARPQEGDSIVENEGAYIGI